MIAANVLKGGQHLDRTLNAVELSKPGTVEDGRNQSL